MAKTAYPTPESLLVAMRGCRTCNEHLPIGPRPVLRARVSARILIVGQAPGIPWDDPSGERLRAWMGIDKKAFYDESHVAIIPMGYCYAGRGNGGDLPPRREYAPEFIPLPHPSPRNQPWLRTIPGLSNNSYRCCAHESKPCPR